MLTHEEVFIRAQWIRNEKTKLWTERYPYDMPLSVLEAYRAKWGNDLTDDEIEYCFSSLVVSANPKLKL